MQNPDEDPALRADVRYAQGVAVGTHITQHNYFFNSAAAPWSGRSGSSPTGGRAARVFISSASGSLAAYRQAAVEVCYRLGLTPVHMEEFNPQRPTPEQACRAEVASCDVFVLLLAHRYGTRPPRSKLSYTELEYECAAGRPQMPLLAFVVDPMFPWPPPDIDNGADAEALARFTARVQTSHVVRHLAELAAFREDLILALRPHETALPTEQPATLSHEPQSEGWMPARPKFYAVPPYAGNAPFTGRASDLKALDNWGRSADPLMVVEAIGGTGKSALTWQWTQDRAPEVIGGLAGRLWWSFYEGSASMTRFLREALVYTTGRPMRQVLRLGRADVADQVIAALRDRPYLLVLDGFERLLAAYHRFDPSKLRDEEIEPNQRALIEPHAEEVMRALTAAGPSRILISTRLMPIALQSRFGTQMAGVRHLRLPGLTDQDTATLLTRLGCRGSPPAITGFFHPLDNHPLLIGVVAGLIRDYRAEPGGIDRWLTDPAAGGALTVPHLDLVQRRTHILEAALSGLEAGSRQLLGGISVLAGSVNWATLEAINPFQPEPADSGTAGTPRRTKARRLHEPSQRAKAQLDAALTDLEQRGLLWWDRASNSYDLHPVIRAYAHDQLEDTDRVQANDRVRDHFEALPPEELDRATSVEDLTQTIIIFRALIGADRIREACWLWNAGIGDSLGVGIGAYATIVELLSPLATTGTLFVRNDLAIAYAFLGRYDEAISIEAQLLADSLRDKSIVGVVVSLGNLAEWHIRIGADTSGARYHDLRATLSDASGEVDGHLALARGEHATARGQVGKARNLLNQAENLGPWRGESSPWFEDSIRCQRLYLALVADDSLTLEQLADAASGTHTWVHRRELANLQSEVFTRQGHFEEALAAAQEHDQLGRNAGLDVAPARTAFLLGKLGRTGEAAAAVDEAMTRLPRIHPADRPRYHLALAMWELGRVTEAASQASHAYRQAWRDGPPNCRHWDLRDARSLLQTMGVPIPDLPSIDPANEEVPLENETRAFIAELESQHQLRRKR